MTTNQGASTRAKFSVWNVARNIDSNDNVLNEVVSFGAVYGQEGENHEFWLATPSAQLNMTITNPARFGHFRPGQQYYLDFTPAQLNP